MDAGTASADGEQWEHRDQSHNDPGHPGLASKRPTSPLLSAVRRAPTLIASLLPDTRTRAGSRIERTPPRIDSVSSQPFIAPGRSLRAGFAHKQRRKRGEICLLATASVC